MKHFFSKHPNLLFALDAGGALISASLLYLLLYLHPARFGLALPLVVMLVIIALLLGSYSLFNSLFSKKSVKFRLRTIIAGNVLYCGLTLCISIIQRQQLKGLGLLYLFLEVVVILLLVQLEIKVLRLVAKQEELHP